MNYVLDISKNPAAAALLNATTLLCHHVNFAWRWPRFTSSTTKVLSSKYKYSGNVATEANCFSAVVEMALRKTRSHYCQTRNFFRLLSFFSPRCPDLSRAILRNYCLGHHKLLLHRRKKIPFFFPLETRQQPQKHRLSFHVTSLLFKLLRTLKNRCHPGKCRDFSPSAHCLLMVKKKSFNWFFERFIFSMTVWKVRTKLLSALM